MITCRFEPNRLRPQSNATHVFSDEFRSVAIKPGNNEYDQETLDWLQAQDGFARLAECGAFVVVSAPAEQPDAPKVSGTIGLNTDDAIALVNATDDAELLMAWDEADKRKTVSAAIVRRIDSLTADV